MTTSTLISAVGSNQNQAGPPVPALTVINTGGLVTHVDFTLTVAAPSPLPVSATLGASAEAVILYGPDNISFPGQVSMYCSPTSGGTTTHGVRIHGANLEPTAGSAPDGAQYFKAELLSVTPGATATLTMTY